MNLLSAPAPASFVSTDSKQIQQLFNEGGGGRYPGPFALVVLCLVIPHTLLRAGKTREQRCKLTCVAQVCKCGHLSARTCSKWDSPPINGTIAHFNNKQHNLLEFSNSQQLRATPNMVAPALQSWVVPPSTRASTRGAHTATWNSR